MIHGKKNSRLSLKALQKTIHKHKGLVLAPIFSGAMLMGCTEGLQAPVDKSDIVDFDSILLENNSDGSGAAQVGEPATFLAEASNAEAEVQGIMRDSFKAIQDITALDPVTFGVNRQGHGYAIWEGQDDTLSYAFGVERRGDRRVRYLLQAKRIGEDTMRPLLTGVFIKRANNRGGGRLHLDLSALSDLSGDVIDGSVHIQFANGRQDRQGRRAAYINVTRRDVENAEPVNFASDLIHIEGEGGRYRSIFASDLIEDNPGNEAVGMRVFWKSDEGGRADVLYAGLEPERVIGTAHECWDANGLRTAYLDSFVFNDDVDPDQGDVTSCAGFVVDEEDTEGNRDPQLDELLQEDGADEIDEEEAQNAEAADDAEQNEEANAE